MAVSAVRAPEQFGFRDRPEEPPPPEPPDWDPPPPEQPPERPLPPQPTITVYAGLRHEAASQGLKAMHNAGVKLFVRGQQLVRVVSSSLKSADGDNIEMPTIVQATVPMLGRLAGQSARWIKPDKTGRLFRVDPPQPVSSRLPRCAANGHFRKFMAC